MSEPLPDRYKLPKIMCFVCKKAVERIVIDEDEYNMSITITVFCHGSKDAMRLDRINAHQIDEDATGIAFQPDGTELPAPMRSIAHG
ncbi:MAG: hypothetical protein PGN22_15745 [Agrobacterium cavarae]